MKYLDENDFLGEYASLIEEAEVPAKDREERLARVKGMWEKYSGDDDVVSFKDLEEAMQNEPPAIKIHTKYEGINNLIDGFRY